MRLTLGLTLGFVVLAFTAAACGGSDPAPTPLDPKLSVIQREVFTVSCALSASCHAGGNPQKGLNLEDGMARASMLRASMEKPDKQIVAPGMPDASFMMDKLLDRNLPDAPTGELPWTEMPPGALLDAVRLEGVRAWIEAGAKDD